MKDPKEGFITVSITAKLRSSSVTDIDGNVYRTVKIGDQWWMAENLRTTKLKDGTGIDIIEGNGDWLSSAADYKPAMCWYGNLSENKHEYGGLYNWAAAGKSELCPDGWHVPTSDDYYILCLFIDLDAAMGHYSDIAGGALKEQGYDHWASPNEGATDQYGYRALPGGYRNVVGEFEKSGLAGSWWSDHGLSSINISNTESSALFSEGGNEYGRSVRCVSDN